MEFDEALQRFGFTEHRRRQSDARLFTAQPNSFLTYTIHA